MTILSKVKKALLIPQEENYADEELSLHIIGCQELLISMGVQSEIVMESGNPLVDSLILIYCKTLFGFKNDGSVKELPKSFDMLATQLALTKG